MTIQEANSNIGQPFKVIGLSGTRFDTIIRVDLDGTIHGDFIEAHCEDCRLKEEQPDHLKNAQHEKGNKRAED